MTKIYEHQESFLEKCENKKILVWEMGTGKTRTAIEWAKRDRGSVLIVCPKALKENWARQADLWGLHDECPKVTIVSKEEFKKLAPTLGYYDNLIIDEAHYFAGLKSQMTKTMLAYIKTHQSPRILALTATPFMRNAWNVLVLGQIMGMDWTYPYFQYRFFDQVRMGQRLIPVQKKTPAAKEELAMMVGQISDIVELADCVDLPAEMNNTIHLNLTADQKKGIKQINEEIFEPVIRYTKEHEICGGFVAGDEYNDTQYFKTEKLDALKNLIEANDKLMVVCRYNEEVNIIVDMVKKMQVPVAQINGKVKDKDAVVQRVRKMDRFVLVVNSACSEGWELPEVEHMVFYSHGFSLKDYVQMKGRIQRINDIRPRTYTTLIVDDTIDASVLKSLESKQDFLLRIYAQNNNEGSSSSNVVS